MECLVSNLACFFFSVVLESKKKDKAYLLLLLLFGQFQKHRVVEKFRHRHVFRQAFAAAGLDHEVSRKGLRQGRLEGVQHHVPGGWQKKA